MSLSIEPKKGIRLKLSGYTPIRAWQGGGKCWEHDFQLTIRQGALAGFLPRAIEEGDSVIYEQTVDGREIVSESTPVSSIDQVPAAQIEALRAALAELKAKADDPLCDHSKRRMIEAFRLPDPRKDAELYRLSGSGRKRQLSVLWGVEKEPGSALAPLEAVGRVPRREKLSGVGSGMSWLWVLVAAALAVGGWYWWQSRQQPENWRPNRDNSVPAAGGQGGNNYIVERGEHPRDNSSGPGRSANASATPDTVRSGGPASTDSSALTGQSSRSRERHGSEPLASSADQSGEAPRLAEPLAEQPSRQPADNDAAPAGRAGDKPMGLADSPVAGGEPSKSDKSGVASGEPAVAADDGIKMSAPTGSPTQPNAEPEPASKPQGSPQLAYNDQAKGPKQPTPSSGEKPTKPEDGAKSASLAADSSSPASADQQSSPVTPSTATGSAPDSSSESPAPGAPPAEPASLPPAGAKLAALEIISTRSANAPKNGQVEVVLSALARDQSGTLIEAPKITEWRVDGVVQKGRNGAPVAAPTLGTALSKGSHRVSVAGTNADGSPLRAEAEIDVNVKVTEESSVQVRPAKR